VVHQNFRLSEVIFKDILDSDHLEITFSILHPVKTTETLDSVENLTNWGLFQSLASELVSSSIQSCASNEADKPAHDFADSITSACIQAID
jgi:Mg/Co/Ni transporter MgtE